MNEIENSLLFFDRIRKYTYKITIENGMEIMLRFSREHYHHLAGFQHLTDLSTVSNPISRQKFYGDIKKGKIKPEQIKKSCQYHQVFQRVNSCNILEDILSPGDGKIIVEFDRSKTDSVIQAKFHLFRRMGDPFRGEAVFYTLFIDCEGDKMYFPVTYVVEHSNRYVREQIMLDCTIERIPLAGKKEMALSK